VVYRSGKHLLGLITDMLDISRLWAGKMDVTLGDVELPEVIQDAVAIAAPLIDDKPIQLVQKLDSDLPTIRTDRTRVRQLLLNLLTNAIKYTKQGGVTVSAWPEKDFVVVSVADTGIGIPPKHIETIFREFGRVDNSSTRETGGLGLGLAISRQLIELLGGEIWVESEVDVGSTFSFSLPVEGPTAASKGQRITHQRLETALAQWQ
jgi:signal transduction histidine kinase